jgi:hypothetical protein
MMILILILLFSCDISKESTLCQTQKPLFSMMNVKGNADDKESGERQANVLPRRKL